MDRSSPENPKLWDHCDGRQDVEEFKQDGLSNDFIGKKKEKLRVEYDDIVLGMRFEDMDTGTSDPGEVITDKTWCRGEYGKGDEDADIPPSKKWCQTPGRGKPLVRDDEPLYNKVPSYLTELFHGPLIRARGRSHLVRDVVRHQETGSLGVPSEPTYSRLPDYATETWETPQRAGRRGGSLLKAGSKRGRTKVPFVRGSSEEISQRCILFIGNLPVGWSDPRTELERVLSWSGLAAAHKIQVKTRFHSHLDSYAFLYFKRPEDAHEAYDYFQKHPEYCEMNVSFGGRDLFLNREEYTDLDSLHGVVDEMGCDLDPAALLPSHDVVSAEGKSDAPPAPDFGSLLMAHKRWQQNGAE